jgi:hypothetical protein
LIRPITIPFARGLLNLDTILDTVFDADLYTALDPGLDTVLDAMRVDARRNFPILRIRRTASSRKTSDNYHQTKATLT